MEERYQITALKGLGYTQRQIARETGRSASTISRELRRNRGIEGYQAETAQRVADRRRREAGKRHKRTPELIAWVEARLRDDWSPEQIAGSLREAGYPLVSHEWIYRHIERDQKAGGDLHKHLRQRRKRYRKRYGSQERRGRIIGRVGIEERPWGVPKLLAVGGAE
ncbi:IS30 family transposase [Thiolapillus sp.]|uniref:IS30 family transposase n=1 Tax=Thiolapillus sp. TaxID=2017437 RepID=UPI0027E54363|nr:IS30 family transposase [Thiolapillus sp.]